MEATTLRSGKVGHILERTKQPRADVREWLEALVSDGTAKASETAIRIVADMVESGADCAAEARRATIVLTEEHGLVAPVPGKVFRRTDEGGLRESLVYVDRALSDDPSLFSALTTLGIREADVRGRFVSVLDQGFAKYGPQEWTRFWELFHLAGAAAVGHEVTKRVPTPMDTLMVRTADGRYHSMRDCMLPGAVVTPERDPDVAVDMQFHSDDAGFFRELGLRPPDLRPQARRGALVRRLPGGRTRGLLPHTRQPGEPPDPCQDEDRGRPSGDPCICCPASRRRPARPFLQTLPEDALIENWTLQIGSQAGTRRTAPSPIRWMLSRHGRVATSQGIKPLDGGRGPQLAAYGDVLPVASISQRRLASWGSPTVSRRSAPSSGSSS